MFEYILKCVCFYLIVVFICFKNIEVIFEDMYMTVNYWKLILLKNYLKFKNDGIV